METDLSCSCCEAEEEVLGEGRDGVLEPGPGRDTERSGYGVSSTAVAVGGCSGDGHGATRGCVVVGGTLGSSVGLKREGGSSVSSVGRSVPPEVSPRPEQPPTVGDFS